MKNLKKFRIISNIVSLVLLAVGIVLTIISSIGKINVLDYVAFALLALAIVLLIISSCLDINKKDESEKNEKISEE